MKTIKVLILFILLVMLSFSLYKISSIKKELDTSEKIKEELIELVEIPKIPSEESSFKVNFEELENINPDVVGWIVIEGTQVNYPIVQSKDNSYYLNHSFDRKWNSLGSIFMDYKSSNDFSDYNTFIYGHHTKNGSMFGELYKYMDESFYKEHPFFYLYTKEGNFKVEIISAYLDSTESDSYNQVFNSTVEFKKYLTVIKSKSKYSTNVEIDEDEDKLISLYSCSHEINRKKSDRYFVHGVIKNI